MICNAGVTLWHNGGYDKETRMDLPPIRQYFPRAAVQKDIKVIADKGLQTADMLKIRIPTEAEIKIANGDKLLPGEHTEAEAPGNAFTVTGFADNRKCSANMRHWKVICV